MALEVEKQILSLLQTMKTCSESNHPKMVRTLEILSKLAVTEEILVNTRVGVEVNRLRKLQGSVGAAATHLVMKWQDMVLSNISNDDSKIEKAEDRDLTNKKEEQNEKRKPLRDSSSFNAHKHSQKRKYESHNTRRDDPYKRRKIEVYNTKDSYVKSKDRYSKSRGNADKPKDRSGIYTNDKPKSSTAHKDVVQSGSSDKKLTTSKSEHYPKAATKETRKVKNDLREQNQNPSSIVHKDAENPAELTGLQLLLQDDLYLSPPSSPNQKPPAKILTLADMYKVDIPDLVLSSASSPESSPVKQPVPKTNLKPTESGSKRSPKLPEPCRRSNPMSMDKRRKQEFEELTSIMFMKQRRTKVFCGAKKSTSTESKVK